MKYGVLVMKILKRIIIRIGILILLILLGMVARFFYLIESVAKLNNQSNLDINLLTMINNDDITLISLRGFTFDNNDGYSLHDNKTSYKFNKWLNFSSKVFVTSFYTTDEHYQILSINIGKDKKMVHHILTEVGFTTKDCVIYQRGLITINCSFEENILKVLTINIASWKYPL